MKKGGSGRLFLFLHAAITQPGCVLRQNTLLSTAPCVSDILRPLKNAGPMRLFALQQHRR